MFIWYGSIKYIFLNLLKKCTKPLFSCQIRLKDRCWSRVVFAFLSVLMASLMKSNQFNHQNKWTIFWKTGCSLQKIHTKIHFWKVLKDKFERGCFWDGKGSTQTQYIYSSTLSTVLSFKTKFCQSVFPPGTPNSEIWAEDISLTRSSVKSYSASSQTWNSITFSSENTAEFWSNVLTEKCFQMFLSFIC